MSSMDMRGQEQRHFRVDLEHTGGYQFTSQAHEDDRRHGEPYVSDEPDPVGAASGPATPALLGSAIAHCLSASLLETLRHAHIPVQDFRAEVDAVVAPNEAGLPRIERVDVVLRPVLVTSSPRSRRCEEVFENHCTVTASVTQGIPVNVSVEWDVLDGTRADQDVVTSARS
jgi:uncharacterized OsmC-like protein